MKKKIVTTLIVLLLLMPGCGPSPEEIATMTASAWTATPTITPSPTHTPIPYNLTLKVTDVDGNAIPGAGVIFGESEPILTDVNGMVSWTNLVAPDGLLAVAAQGYFTSDQTFSLNRGSNELVVALERDPIGLLPSQACAPDETLLYVEDFQDGSGQGWNEIEYYANGWLVEEFPAEPGNLVASNSNMEHHGHSLQDVTFGDAVWRVRFFVSGRRLISFNWLENYNIEIEGQQIDNSRYQIVLDTDGIGIRRLTLPVMNIGAASGRGAKAENWHTIEISTFQGRTEVWLDGQKKSGYTDPKPLPSGGIGLEFIPFDTAKPGTIVYFDNMSICGLSAPFSSLYVAP